MIHNIWILEYESLFIISSLFTRVNKTKAIKLRSQETERINKQSQQTQDYENLEINRLRLLISTAFESV